MRPGVTGLAQVNGRNSIPWSRRLALDVEYVDNYSLWLDVKILALTTVVWFTGHGLVLDRNPQEADDLPRGERVEGTTHDSSVSGEL